MADEDYHMCAWKLQGGDIPSWVKARLPKKSDRVVEKPDCRAKVSRSDIQNGGKFRSVVKVRTVIGDWMSHGTGWLIQDNLVVTTGHLVVDVPSKQYNMQTFATIVRVYIGYSGKDTMDSEDVDFWEGTVVVVPRNYATKKKWVHDFAFVELNQPFDNVSPIQPLVTPHSGHDELCIVGYPTDKEKKCLNRRSEKGAEMYEDHAKVEWDLEVYEGLLAYKIPTYNGKFPKRTVDSHSHYQQAIPDPQSYIRKTVPRLPSARM